MKKNFAGQADNSYMLDRLTAMNLTTDITKPVTATSQIFLKSQPFIDNCSFKPSKNMTGKMNAGGFFDGIDLNTLLDTAKFGVGTWSAQQAQKAANEQAALAAEIERQKSIQAAAEAAAAQSKASTIKAYTVPIAIAGGLVIVGIATYFIFKKKKIS